MVFDWSCQSKLKRELKQKERRIGAFVKAELKFSQKWVDEVSRKVGNVSEAYKFWGYSMGSFYRFYKLYEEDGELVLKDKCSKPHLKNG